MNRRITQVALAAAAAMTISLASPVAANAKDSAGATVDAQVQSAPAAVQPTGITRNPGAHPTVTALRVGSTGTLSPYGRTSYIRPAVINYNIPEGWSMIPTARLTKGSRSMTTSFYDGTSLSVPTSWGAGVYRVDRITFKRYDGTQTYTAPNYLNFRVRQPLHYGGRLQIQRKGSKLTFKVTKIRAYNGKKYVKVKHKVRVQVKKGKKWKNLKKFKVNKKGKKSFSIRHRGKRKYRLVVPTSKIVLGAKTRAIKI